ncbi:carboxypeptidase [Treponema primitia ZAS-2]|uniref:Carboxypeptidase n=1 Tax=Treponema primitia (strain ATCC BAA-887 / DSM 12427 / ZAS-2) TaxID=545694 RepID=F5YPD4_TREPZ|nr:M15 family metallopeptidase [Treponema primitia]AEF83871.1 carboxypeptidase [Treponema primitia ZAS-2]
MFLLVMLCSCSRAASQASAENTAGSAGRNSAALGGDTAGTGQAGGEEELVFFDKLQRALSDALIPGDLSRRVLAAATEGPDFILDLLACMEGDPFLRRLVDKTHPLPDHYEPADLEELRGGAYQINRRSLMLRREAARALETMAAAAQVDGAILLASSSYRSYDYQEELYARYVREDGQEAADRFSARPGYSQHQTGLVVDFGSIDDSFAETRSGRWILTNGSRYGWSLSFPQGYEAVTGYVWESWHYRYVGPELAFFIDTYFDGIQQYALQFIHEWENSQ